MENEIKKLADDHWKWVEGFISTMSDMDWEVSSLEYLYKTAFVHGYKHGSQQPKEDDHQPIIEGEPYEDMENV